MHSVVDRMKELVRIVTSSEQARDVISQGKMAVFLGIEVDTIFGADTDFVGKYNAGEITEEEMTQVWKYRKAIG